MKKLISMTDFVLNEQKKCNNDPGNYGRGSLILIWNYANFLKQPLTLGMFVPAKFVNGEWVVLEDIKNKTYTVGEIVPNDKDYCKILKEYQEAKDRVIFNVHLMKGKANHLREIWNDEKYLFTYNESIKLFLTVGSTIESLVKYNLVLTESAKKQIGIS